MTDMQANDQSVEPLTSDALDMAQRSTSRDERLSRVYQKPHRRKASAASIRIFGVTSPGHSQGTGIRHIGSGSVNARVVLLRVLPSQTALSRGDGMATCCRAHEDKDRENRGYGQASECMAVDCSSSWRRDTSLARGPPISASGLASSSVRSSTDLGPNTLMTGLLDDSRSPCGPPSQSPPIKLQIHPARAALPVPCSVEFESHKNDAPLRAQNLPYTIDPPGLLWHSCRCPNDLSEAHCGFSMHAVIRESRPFCGLPM